MKTKEKGRCKRPLDTNVIYRCGWCGHPTTKEGRPLKTNPAKYLERFKSRKEEHVQGDCCPNGNEDQQPQRVQITREMAMDAGMPEIEGQWTNW